MKKVFRIHNAGASESDWFPSLEPGEAITKTIKDNSNQTEDLPTSIPSPFARMDLVRSAFSYVNDKANGIDGSTYHHKLVSDALDIGQILFNYDTNEEHLEIVAWDKQEQLNLLKGSGMPEHQALAETMELFLNQDKQFNFQLLDKFYILKYNHRVIGGTSPTTLFFAAPFNDKKAKQDRLMVNIQFGNDIMLDEQYLPLYLREPKFIKYMYALSRSNNFASVFSELYEYIDNNVKKIAVTNPALFNELNKLNPVDYFAGLERLFIGKVVGDTVDVLKGMPLYKHVSNPESIQSDFVIDSPKQVEVKGKMLSPLVLPVDTFNYPLMYTSEPWNPGNPAPAKDETPVVRRRLPYVKDHYPYLTQADFLEDYLIKLPYQVNHSKFYTLDKNYLLPLKKTFFEYIDQERLIARDLLKVIEHTQSVEVKLNIPIKGNQQVKYITYTKIYKKPSSVTSVGGYSGLGENDGTLLEAEFALAVSPFVKGDFPNKDYRVGVVNKMLSQPIDLQFLSGKGDSIESSFVSDRLKTPADSSTYYVVKNEFDLIQIRLKGGSVQGVLLPKFKQYISSSIKYSFAVDFGTSNTHIEYKTNQMNDSQPFIIGQEESQVVFTFRSNDLKNQIVKQSYFQFSHEMLPEKINDGTNEYKLPMRTVVLFNGDVDTKKGTYTYNHYNIAFDFEKAQIQPHLHHKTNIKWSNYNDTDNRKQLEHYVEHLLLLLRNKVLHNNGDFAQTEITWFYPSSMGESKIKALGTIWDNKVEEVFGLEPRQVLRSLPESLAPFYFYNNEKSVTAQSLPVVSLDIGGGTADIVVYQEDKPKLITSFKFAGNAIFGDGYGGSMSTNGFLSKHLNEYRSILAANSDTLNRVLDQLSANRHSEDIINFLFSLAQNKELQDKNVPTDFAKILANDEDLRLVFILYYTAVFYHLVKILKQSGFEKPSTILLSGSGSKTAFIADISHKQSDLALLFNKVHTKITGNTSQTNIQIEPNPKEITAKGGLYTQRQDLGELEKLTVVSLGGASENGRLFRPFDTTQELGKFSYQEISGSKEVLESIVDEVVDFLKLFKELHKEINFKNKFGVSQTSLNVIDEILNNGYHELMNFLMRGLEEKKKELGSDDVTVVEETLFFYPLIGVLNKLAKESTDEKQEEKA